MPSKRSSAVSSASPRKRPARSSQISLSLRSTPIQADHYDQETTDYTDSENDLAYSDEVIMAVDMRDRGTIGCCYYATRDESLFLMAEVKLGGIDIIDMRRPVNFGLEITQLIME